MIVQSISGVLLPKNPFCAGFREHALEHHARVALSQGWGIPFSTAAEARPTSTAYHNCKPPEISSIVRTRLKAAVTMENRRLADLLYSLGRLTHFLCYFLGLPFVPLLNLTSILDISYRSRFINQSNGGELLIEEIYDLYEQEMVQTQQAIDAVQVWDAVYTRAIGDRKALLQVVTADIAQLEKSRARGSEYRYSQNTELSIKNGRSIGKIANDEKKRELAYLQDIHGLGVAWSQVQRGLLARDRRQVIEALYRDHANRARLSRLLAAGFIDCDKNLEERINRWIKLMETLAQVRKNFCSSDPDKFLQAQAVLRNMGVLIFDPEDADLPSVETRKMGWKTLDDGLNRLRPAFLEASTKPSDWLALDEMAAAGIDLSEFLKQADVQPPASDDRTEIHRTRSDKNFTDGPGKTATGPDDPSANAGSPEGAQVGQ